VREIAMRELHENRSLRALEYSISILAGALFAVTLVMVLTALVMRYGMQYPSICVVGKVLGNVQVLESGTFTDVLDIDLRQSLLSIHVLLYWVFATACCLLLFRARIIRRERRALRAQLLPAQPAAVITTAEAAATLRALEPYQGTLVATLIERSLQHCQHTNLPAETAVCAAASAEVFANMLRPQYAFIMFCAYALPLIGLIGTLLGISRVVAWLGASEADISFATLGASFDAALVALVSTFVLLFFISMTQAAEEEQICAAHDYCLAHLPGRLDDAVVPHTHPL
jgi:biopolymer transport protein ExbB/TolQ